MNDPPPTLAIRPTVETLSRAADLARRLDLPLLEADAPSAHDLELMVTPDRLELHVLRSDDPDLVGGRPVCVDLSRVDATSGHGRSTRQPIARAIGLSQGQPPPRVLDLTAGLGEDAFLLASLGCEVVAVERSPVVAALLEDGVARIADDVPDVADRLTVRCADSLAVFAAGEVDADVIYLDPMFPSGRKTVERKPMRVLRRLVGHDRDADELFRAALAAGPKRVIVKRPARAAPIVDIPPTSTHRGAAMRYDVYVPAAMSL